MIKFIRLIRQTKLQKTTETDNTAPLKGKTTTKTQQTPLKTRDNQFKTLGYTLPIT